MIEKKVTVKELRSITGLSQQEFCKKYHIGLRALQSWEQGQRNTPESIIFLLQSLIAKETGDDF